MEKEMRVAVLIDSENISSKYIEVILSEANVLGNVIYKRIYGNWTMQNMSSWKDVILDNSIQPIQQYSNTTGKNSTDSSLIIDTMDLLYSGRLNAFCIVSSDSDFTRLAARLRESEMYVLGMGEQKTPRSFISACNKFLYLDILYSTSQKITEEEVQKNSIIEKVSAEKKQSKVQIKQSKEDTAAEEKTGSNIQRIKLSLQQLTEENADDDGWINSSKLGNLINKQFPDFDVRNFGHRRFFQFIESLDLFESKRDGTDLFFKLKY
ncbi:MAG: NYN domain-containing protein [Oscillospiraceae bacterium]|nr:NYN domain-containing protein [Oscillospiraceae bacterium]